MKEGFLLTNRRGGYALITPRTQSKYDGVFFMHQDRIFKVIDSFEIEGELNEITHKFWRAEKVVDGKRVSYFMPNGKNLFEVDSEGEIRFRLLLDMRETNDMREWGRFYELEEHDDKLLIRYEKRDTQEEPDGEYTMYLAISKSDIRYEQVDEWVRREYEYDKSRNPHSPARYVYNPLILTGERFLFSFGMDKQKVLKDLEMDVDEMKEAKREQTLKLLEHQPIEDHRIDLAYKCSLYSVDQLSTKQGMFAGLPWFFQYWARDELISLKSLIMTGKVREASRILERYLGLIGDDGRVPNRYPPTDLCSADGIGWLMMRLHDILPYDDIVQEHRDRIEIGVNSLMEHHIRDGLAYNTALETWIDTEWDNDTREGFRIEIQALFLHMLKFMHELTGNHKYKRQEEDMRNLVRDKFWNGEVLADGLDDWTIRPNIFLAAYLYPELLSKEEWTECFKNALDALWLDWGGVTSIQKDSPLFCDEYTGENNKSYHRGDSWFFVNNFTALVLHRINKDEFRDEIEKIILASTYEILESGIVGGHAELSSAKELRSEGSPVQLWSSATYIELIREIF